MENKTNTQTGQALESTGEKMSATETTEIECPECQGTGFVQPASEHPLGAEICPDCDSTPSMKSYKKFLELVSN